MTLMESPSEAHGSRVAAAPVVWSASTNILAQEPTSLPTLSLAPREAKAKRPSLKINTEPAPTNADSMDALVQVLTPLTVSGSMSSASASSAMSLAARRFKNKKQLSLIVPGSTTSSHASSQLLSPSGVTMPLSPSLHSLPSSPVPLSTFIGVEGAEEEDRTIGRLMMKAQADEMREQMKGKRSMQRRTSLASLPTLVRPSLATIAASAVSEATTSSSTGSSSFVSFVRSNKERIDEGASPDDENIESFPYEWGPREIMPGVFLGSEENAKNPTLLAQYGINLVLNVAKEVACPWVVEEGGSSPSKPSSRPSFVRPTASTPNLQQHFDKDQLSIMSPVPAEDESRSSSSPVVPTISRSPSKKGLPPAVPMRRHLQANRSTGRPEIDYLWLPWGHDEADLVESGKLDEAFDFIDQARASNDGKGRVLVHCQCGVSRSATVVIAWAMREAARRKRGDLSTVELNQVDGMHSAYSYVKDKSHWIGPNLSLVFQLVAYERHLRGSDPSDAQAFPSPVYHPGPTGAEQDGSESNSSTPSCDTRSTRVSNTEDVLLSPSLTTETKMTSPRSLLDDEPFVFNSACEDDEEDVPVTAVPGDLEDGQRATTSPGYFDPPS